MTRVMKVCSTCYPWQDSCNTRLLVDGSGRSETARAGLSVSTAFSFCSCCYAHAVRTKSEHKIAQVHARRCDSWRATFEACVKRNADHRVPSSKARVPPATPSPSSSPLRQPRRKFPSQGTSRSSRSFRFSVWARKFTRLLRCLSGLGGALLRLLELLHLLARCSSATGQDRPGPLAF